MQNNTNTILLIIIAILGFLYLRSCNSTPGHNGQGVADLTPDTLYIQGKTDTLELEKKIYITKWLKPDSIEIIVDSITNDTTNIFRTEVADSLLTGTITSKVRGQLISSSFSYTPLFPKYITRVDSFNITKPVPVHVPKWGVYAGGIIGGNANSFTLEPTILIKTNKNLQFSVGYGLINKTYNVGLYTKINNPFK
jgi:hypothetical protein